MRRRTTIPHDPRDLDAGGTLQALQVTSDRTGEPIVFHDGQADQDITSPDVRELHTYGRHLRTAVGDAAQHEHGSVRRLRPERDRKQDEATPFKRPEYGVFAPGTGFSRFVFTETGDTDARPARLSAASAHCSN